MRLVSRTLAALFVLVFVLAATCSAQDGAITGKVTDSSGAALPGVSLTLSSASVMGVRNVVTDEQGGYRFGLLPPGTYTVKLELSGFATVVRGSVAARAGVRSSLISISSQCAAFRSPAW